MKPNETLLNTMENRELHADETGHDHLSASQQTPLRPDAFELSDDDKIQIIEGHFAEIMHTLGLDLTDDSLKGTPHRVAKMYVKEVFSGLNPKNRPHARSFSNHYNYNQMLVERNITLFSYCEHHFVPIVGKAHVAYIPNEHVVGLSKLNRIVQYYAKRPQVQERLTIQIAHELKKALRTDNVAVLIEADHLCVMSRGVNDISSNTITSEYSGLFQEAQYRNEFLHYLGK
ncbi:GTP cyclohydrolase I FolE [Adhaeribacter terrigena]